MFNILRLTAFFSFIFSIVFLTACGSSSAKQEKPKEPVNIPATVSDKPKIVAFGDSLTAGFGLLEKESYPYLLQEKLKADGYPYEVVNAGISGFQVCFALQNKPVNSIVCALYQCSD